MCEGTCILPIICAYHIRQIYTLKGKEYILCVLCVIARMQHTTESARLQGFELYFSLTFFTWHQAQNVSDFWPFFHLDSFLCELQL